MKSKMWSKPGKGCSKSRYGSDWSGFHKPFGHIVYYFAETWGMKRVYNCVDLISLLRFRFSLLPALRSS